MTASTHEEAAERGAVANTSNTCAWVSLYLRRNQTPWHMETAPESKPRDIKAGLHHTFYVRFGNSNSSPRDAAVACAGTRAGRAL